MICRTCNKEHITECDVLRCRILELEKQLEAVYALLESPYISSDSIVVGMIKAAIGEGE